MVTITYHLRSPPSSLIASKHFLKWMMTSFLLHLNPRDSTQIVCHKTQHGPPWPLPLTPPILSAATF